MPADSQTPELDKLPKLRQGITCTFNDYDIHGRPHWMINDASRNKFFIIGWAEYQIFQQWHLGKVDAIVEAINEKTTLNISPAEIENFYLFLKNNFLIQQSGYDIHQLGINLNLFKGDHYIKWLIDHYLFFRVPLWHPDKFLQRTNYFSSFIFSRNLFYLMLGLAFLALYNLSTQWEEFTHTFSSIFTIKGIIFYLIAFLICKGCHEMGHAYMCRHYGIPVQSFGVAFLVFWPVLYTDTTLSWVLKSQERMKIALAGIWVETYITIIAALIWCNTSETTLKTTTYMIISVNWIMSLLINVSPFMRFDGYYILSDFMKMPNLQPRAFALTRWQLRQLLFGWSAPPPEIYTARMKWFLILYSVATWLYRLSLYLGIAVLVYHFAVKIVGIVLFSIEIFYFVILPLFHEIQTWYILRDRFHWNTRTVISVAVASILFLAFILPIQTSISLPGTLSYLHEFIITQEEGQIEGKIPRAGQIVKKGDVILELKSVDLENALILIKLQYEKKLNELRNSEINADDINHKVIILSDLNKSQAEYSKAYELYEKLTLRAPFNGVINEISSDLAPGVFVKKNEWIADLVDLSNQTVEAYIDEADLKRVTLGLKGYFYPTQIGDKKIPVKLISIDALNNSQLSCLYSKSIKHNAGQNVIVDTPCYNASEVGGGVATYISNDGSFVPVKSVYRVKLLPENLEKITHVERGTVVVHAEPISFASKVFNWIKNILVAQSEL